MTRTVSTDQQRIVEATNEPEERLEDYIERHFDTSCFSNHASNWMDRANENKTAIAKMLGLPHPNSGFMIDSSKSALSADQTRVILNLIKVAEADNPILESLSLGDSSVSSGIEKLQPDFNKLTYTIGGKQRKLIRQLKKSKTENQQRAFHSICNLIGVGTYGQNFENADGDYPFDTFWAKLGELINSKFSILITPDPLMLLGSGLFKNSGSCHMPGGQYQYGPFTYGYDSHTLAAFVFSDREANTLGDDALLTPYMENFWRSNLEPSTNAYCGRVLGRTLYHISNPILDSNTIENPTEKLLYFVQSRPYGVMNDDLLREARHAIAQRYREFNNIVATPWKTFDNENADLVYMPSFTYGDGTYYKPRYISLDLQGTPQTMDKENLPEIDLEVPPCPVCGNYRVDDCGCIENSESCCSCGSGINTDDDCHDYCPDGDLYCSECFNDHFGYCECCDETVPRDCMEEVVTRHGTSYWCDHCVSHNATTCEECSLVYADDHHQMTTVNSKGYSHDMCERCVEDQASYCDSCSDAWENGDLEEHNGDHLCPSCLEDVQNAEAEEARLEAEAEEEEARLEAEAEEEENEHPSHKSRWNANTMTFEPESNNNNDALTVRVEEIKNVG